jgi:hypothetical protein
MIKQMMQEWAVLVSRFLANQEKYSSMHLVFPLPKVDIVKIA